MPKATVTFNFICYIMSNVISHTARYEKQLEKERRLENNPNERILRGDNIWNVCVIDNIDFKEKTFCYDNIFDVVRRTAHATLRMVFQFTLPKPLSEIVSRTDSNTNFEFQVGISSLIKDQLQQFEKIFYLLIEGHNRNFDVTNVRTELRKITDMGCNVSPPNVVILELGDNPCNNENVHNAAKMYFNDVGIDSLGHIDLAADEAIFRRLVSLHETHPEIRPLLGAWHTNKSMCTTLIAIFSGYGIFKFAAVLGVSYFDKLEKVVDYPATCRVLELIWVAVGIAITLYVKNKNITMQDIFYG